MRRGLLPFVVLAACLTAGTAGATSRVTIPARSAVTALAADGTDTSFCGDGDLDGLRPGLRLAGDGAPTGAVGKKQRCKAKGLGITALAVTKGRALWVTATGNPVATLNLWTATTTKPTPKALATATRDIQANEPVPIVVGSAGGGLLPYADGDDRQRAALERSQGILVDGAGRASSRSPRATVG